VYKVSQVNKSPFFYGWVVLFFGFLALFATLGIRNSFGAYVTLWEETFLVSRTMVAAISTLSLVVYGLGQPVAGKLVDRWGGRMIISLSLVLIGGSLMVSAFATDFWQLLLLYGVVASLGFSGASNVTVTALVSRWFEKKRGRAMGLVLAGISAGPLLLVPLTLFLIESFDWRWTLFGLGVVVGLVLAPLSFIFIRSKPEDKGLMAYGQTHVEKKTTDHHAGSVANQSYRVPDMLKNRLFWMLAIPFFVCGFTDLGLIFTHLIPYAEGKGFSLGVTSLVFSVIAFFSILGSIASGSLSDRMHRGKQLVIIYGLRAVTFLLLMMADTPSLLIIFAVLFGLTEVAAIAPTSALCAHLFGTSSVGVVFGFISLCHQIGAAVGAFLPGLLYDLFGTYEHAFILSLGLLAISALLVYRVPDMEGKVNAGKQEG
jgi:MFS family permease